MTPSPLLVLAALAAAFLAGSAPFALLIGLAKGVDIRAVGSKNPGATNLGRTLGFRYFLAAFALDAAKGFLPTFAFGLLIGAFNDMAWLSFGPLTALAWLAVAVAPILGHMFSPWIGFKGGKGVATGLGALLGVYPVLTIPAIGGAVVFGATFFIWRYVGLSSVLAAATLPLWTWYFLETASKTLLGPPENPGGRPTEADPVSWPYLIVTTLLAAFIIAKHAGNIRRLIAGTEPKIGKPPAQTGAIRRTHAPDSSSDAALADSPRAAGQEDRA